MGQIAETSLADVVRGLGRYRPVAVTVGIIVVTGLILGPLTGSDDDSTDLASSLDTSASTAPGLADPGRDDDAESGDADPEVATPPAADLGSPSPRRTVTPPRSTRTPSPSPSPSPAGNRSPGGSPSLPPPPSFSDDTGDEEEEPQVTATLWVSRQAGTPLADSGVPEGTLPVGTRLSQTDKATYLRVEGSGVLVLTEDPEGRREPQPSGEASVRACQVTEGGWEEGEAASFDDAPPHDEEACVDGIAGSDGTWSFDLSGLDGETGIALVPGAEAPVDYQVALVVSS